MIRIVGAVLAALAIAACATQTTPRHTPGTASLDIQGRLLSCNSIGGCEYAALLDGPAGHSEALFAVVGHGPQMRLEGGLPDALGPGDYRLRFEGRMMSDAITNDGRSSFGIGGCSAAFTVGDGRWVVVARVEFSQGGCAVSVGQQEAE